MLVDIITEEAHQIIQYNVRMISRLVAERKRFENWLQLEILTRLMEKFPAIEIEKAFPGTQERCDFWLKEQTGEESWIELKLCVTNYCSNYCEISSARPITNQISDIKRDLHKLHRLPTAHS